MRCTNAYKATSIGRRRIGPTWISLIGRAEQTKPWALSLGSADVPRHPATIHLIVPKASRAYPYLPVSPAARAAPSGRRFEHPCVFDQRLAQAEGRICESQLPPERAYLFPPHQAVRATIRPATPGHTLTG